MNLEHIVKAPGGEHRPTLVVLAERDVVFPVREEQQTAQAYGAEFILIKDQAHDLMVERDWRQVAAIAREWLERVEGQHKR